MNDEEVLNRQMDRAIALMQDWKARPDESLAIEILTIIESCAKKDKAEIYDKFQECLEDFELIDSWLDEEILCRPHCRALQANWAYLQENWILAHRLFPMAVAGIENIAEIKSLAGWYFAALDTNWDMGFEFLDDEGNVVQSHDENGEVSTDALNYHKKFIDGLGNLLSVLVQEKDTDIAWAKAFADYLVDLDPLWANSIKQILLQSQPNGTIAFPHCYSERIQLLPAYISTLMKNGRFINESAQKFGHEALGVCMMSAQAMLHKYEELMKIWESTPVNDEILAQKVDLYREEVLYYIKWYGSLLWHIVFIFEHDRGEIGKKVFHNALHSFNQATNMISPEVFKEEGSERAAPQNEMEYEFFNNAKFLTESLEKAAKSGWINSPVKFYPDPRYTPVQEPFESHHKFMEELSAKTNQLKEDREKQEEEDLMKVKMDILRQASRETIVQADFARVRLERFWKIHIQEYLQAKNVQEDVYLRKTYPGRDCLQSVDKLSWHNIKFIITQPDEWKWFSCRVFRVETPATVILFHLKKMPDYAVPTYHVEAASDQSKSLVDIRTNAAYRFLGFYHILYEYFNEKNQLVLDSMDN